MRDTWRQCLLGDVITLKRGYDLPNSQRREGPFPIISSSGPSGLHDEAKVAAPGVVTGRYGTLGEVFYVNEPFWPLNTALYVRDFKGNSPRFISYFLQTLSLGSRNAAGAVPGVNRNHLHAMQVCVPPIPTQQRIAHILSAYDDLIEVNRRRIAILEDMARRLFEEWFVQFRFPGKGGDDEEGQPGSPPEGWRQVRLGNLIKLEYGKALRSDDRREGSIPVYGSSGQVGTHDQALVKGPGLIVGRKGNVGSIHWAPSDFHPIDTVFYVVSSLPLRWLLQLLQRQRFLNSDSAVPGLNREQAYSLEVLEPPHALIDRYAAIVEPLEAQAEALTISNNRLRAARDLLLPKLISGEIEVGAADVRAMEAA